MLDEYMKNLGYDEEEKELILSSYPICNRTETDRPEAPPGGSRLRDRGRRSPPPCEGRAFSILREAPEQIPAGRTVLRRTG